MAEENIEAKLKHLLKQEKVQLWKPPYTTDDGEEQPGEKQMQVGSALESIRSQAVRRGQGNKTFKETSVATLELLLPRDGNKDTKKKKNYLETKLDVPVQEIMNRIGEEYGLKYIKLILNGKTLSADQRLDEQGVRNNSKMMVLRVSEEDRRRQISEEEQKKNQKESIQRTQKGFQILSERDGSDDPETMPFLEIADQKGNPLKIPHEEKKALILAMGFHEKGRSLLKRKQRGVVERQALKEQERNKSRRRLEGVAVLKELGYSRRDASRALHKAEGDVDKAYAILVDTQTAVVTNNNTETAVSQELVQQLLYLGFEREVSETALRLTGGDIQSATQLLLDNQGFLSPDLLLDSPPSSSSEEPSTSSDDPSTSSRNPRTSSKFQEDTELVNEVLGDISHHEEDYLDLTLEEESELIA
ncbi:hypothetical protein CRUP_004559, partial [Coryphaenoides rupestris]